MVSQLEDLLRYDHENAAASKQLLLDLDPRTIATAEKIDEILVDFADAFGPREDKVVKAERLLVQWSSRLGVQPEEALKLLEHGSLIGQAADGDSTEQTKSALLEGLTSAARGYLLLRLRRDYLFGLTDLLRGRVTMSSGYLRLQAETVAIMFACLDNPEIGAQWLRTQDDAEGRRFYRSHHGRFLEILERHDLKREYDRASGTALHSRVGGVARGITQANLDKDGGAGRSLGLVYQEHLGPERFFLAFCYYLKFHEKVACLLNQLLPEVDPAGELGEKILRLSREMADLWQSMKSEYRRSHPAPNRSTILWTPD